MFRSLKALRNIGNDILIRNTISKFNLHKLELSINEPCLVKLINSIQLNLFRDPKCMHNNHFKMFAIQLH
jgi:hypothetical protein